MTSILVSVDDFTHEHREKIREAASGWAETRFITEDTPEAEYRAALERAEIVIGWPDPTWLPGTPVKFLQIGSAGFDSYVGHALDFLKLCTARGVHSIGVAEHAIAMLLALVRNIPQHVRDMESRTFRRIFPYGEVTGSTACIVGLGSIGRTLAKRCRGLEMKTIGVDVREANSDPTVDLYFHLRDVRDALGQADAVFLTLPGGPGTERMFNADLLAAIKPGALFFNSARGSLVDEDALVGVLKSGALGGAGLDVAATEPLPAGSPLWDLENVFITGHCGGFAEHMFTRFCDLACRNLEHYRCGEPLENNLDWETLWVK
jgi:phosphoglycerate dehydrogenase-like enzyme